MALGPLERFGLEAMQSSKCTQCHTPPLFSNNEYVNIGLRRSELDGGRADVTGNPADAGAMRVPSLRNVGLLNRFTHTGQFGSLGETINFYRNAPTLPDTDTLPDGSAYGLSLHLMTVGDIQTFLSNALTDPRVAAEAFPFDRPRLGSER
jgi:cytochrome c peroxidase